MSKDKMNIPDKCKRCEFYNKCKNEDKNKFSNKNIEKCTDFIIKKKLIMF